VRLSRLPQGCDLTPVSVFPVLLQWISTVDFHTARKAHRCLKAEDGQAAPKDLCATSQDCRRAVLHDEIYLGELGPYKYRMCLACAVENHLIAVLGSESEARKAGIFGYWEAVISPTSAAALVNRTRELMADIPKVVAQSPEEETWLSWWKEFRAKLGQPGDSPGSS
jgi:hypothetical protein